MSTIIRARRGERIVLDEYPKGYAERLNARLNGIAREPLDDLEYSRLDRLDGLPRRISESSPFRRGDASEGAETSWWDRFLDSTTLLTIPFSVGAVALIVVVGVHIARSLGWS